ncbi:MAG: metal ABC transporter substrate-binding protein [Planctomycetota bacterium]|nr:metal ABC transporter substrate-binding protein [Planctomycetota bacterium]
MHPPLRPAAVAPAIRSASFRPAAARRLPPLLALLVAFLSPLLAMAAQPAAPAAPAASATPAPPIRAVVTIPPLKGILEPLLPEGSTVTVLMPPGRSEHGYEFTPKDLAAVARADLVFYVGLALEPRVEQTLAKDPRPTRQVVCFADAVGIKADAAHEHHDHDHDEHCDHGPVDQHLWLDPVLVAQVVPALATSVRAAAERAAPLSPAARNDLASREASLVARVRAVDDAWRIRLAPFQGRPIVTHHNAFPRPAARYGLRVAAVIRGFENAEPTPARLAEVVQAIRAERVRAIFAEPQFNQSTARRIAQAAGVSVATLDPLGDGDWFQLMGSNLDALAANLAAKN